MAQAEAPTLELPQRLEREFDAGHRSRHTCSTACRVRHDRRTGYGCLIALLLALAAWLVERWLGALRWPRRWVWIAAFLAAFAVPAAVLVPRLVRTPTIAVTTISQRSADVPSQGGRSSVPLLPAAILSARGRDLWQVDAMLRWLWVAVSASLLSCFAASYWSLRRKLLALPCTCVDGMQLRITDELGPAVFGILRPLIILPRWLIEAPAATRALVIAHERARICVPAIRCCWRSLCCW